MGFGTGLRVPLWVLMLAICCEEMKAWVHRYDNPHVKKISNNKFLQFSFKSTAFNPAHNGRVCSTWGNFNFKTFDGDIFYFPGLCNYVFASHCKSVYEEFNIQIRRILVEKIPTLNHITMKLDGVVLEIAKDYVVLNGNRVQMPYSQSGVIIERSSIYVKVTAKIGLVFMWDEEQSILLEMDEKYANQTCGLCGDFNGNPTYDEFYSNDVKLTAVQFGNMQKMDGPTEVCQDPMPSSPGNCTDNFDNICHRILTGPSFFECNAMVEVNKYIESCVQDLCRCDQSQNSFCICNTIAEYSRQCAHAGGQPQNWRTQELCPKTCPFNMQYQECGSSCSDTCTNPDRSQFCEDHCMDGCFCPPGTVFDDINNSGCIPLQQCSCTYNGNSYAPGTSYSGQCHSCTCTGGQWSCKDISCPGTCSVEGGSHISTFDEKHYTIHGDCSYVISKLCTDDTFTVLGELRKCGLTDTETCLKSVVLSINGGQTIIVIKSGGGVFVNWIYTQLPISAANVTMFRPSSFFTIIQTNLGIQLEIQLIPIMQVYVHLDPSFKDQTCGLCGNFNNVQLDDFKAMSGVVEGTAAAFANTWKTLASCPDIKNNFENPCSLSIENEKYAQHWCGLLTDSKGPFAECHSAVNTAVYHSNCMFDTCNCEKSEDCLCAALSSYVRACANKGVFLSGWRTNICSKYSTSCPKSLSYSYSISSCQPTCRSLSEPDVTCNIKIIPVDGCTCEKGTYMDEYGKCVPASMCPCYYKGSPVPSGEVVHENGLVCACAQGKLNCIGALDPKPVCAAPMVYFDCRNATVGTPGAECQKSCQTLDMLCYSTQCMSGCMCPAGLVSDGKGNCIAEEECPCVHNDATYQPGEKIKVDCNTCVCKNRMWECSKEKCLGTCAVYGDGHYVTFDDKRYNFNGDCEYTLIQDHCTMSSSVNGTFRVITENIPCGTTGTTCSKSIKIFMGSYELKLSDEHFEVVKRGYGNQLPYKLRYMGIYLMIEINNGLILLWDKKTSIFIKLSPDFKGQVCGLCGNYDGNGINDFTTRSQSVVGDVLEFGNSWKASPTCPDAKCIKDPCSKNPYRKSWSQKQCSIINSQVFAACHSQVEPTRYYEACVTDACACDAGGDCECFCTAVAAYAQACSEVGVCVSWRTPSICPMFCDYYNPEGGCEWHYKACGAPCMKTCRNPSGRCLHMLPGLEGCYPHCPANKPYFSEDEMKCVEQCGCYDGEGNYHQPGTDFYSRENSCYCYYEGNRYAYKDVIYNTNDGIGGCITAICDVNGTIQRKVTECIEPTTTPPFTFTTVPVTTTTSLQSTPFSKPTASIGTEGTTEESTTPRSGTPTLLPPLPKTTATTVIASTQPTTCEPKCQWTQWFDVHKPSSDRQGGDLETYENIEAAGEKLCKKPQNIECRAENYPEQSIDQLEQKVQCNVDLGLICKNQDQSGKFKMCYNYQIKVYCCDDYTHCGGMTTIIATKASSTATPPFTSQNIPTVTATSLQSTPFSKPTALIGTATTRTGAVTPTTTIQSTPCQPKCAWSSWLDAHEPSSAIQDGDLETYENIRAAGGEVCEKPRDIECRAEDYPNVPIDQVGQKVQCDLEFGFVCRNEEQSGKLRKCFNYQIRVLCCDDYSHCPETTPATTTPTGSVGTATSQGTTQVSTSPGTTTPELGTTPLPPLSSTTGAVSTTRCQPKCAWSSWLDAHEPSSAIQDGDLETYENIRAAGGEVCEKPRDIECRAEDYPDVPIDQVGQKVQCDSEFGFVCKNEEQSGKLRQCFNYQIRVLCCDDYSQCLETTPATTTPTGSVAPPSTPSGTVTGNTFSLLLFQTNESWMVNNCTMAICEGDNRIALVLPPPVEEISCASGRPPVKVYEEDRCNYHYECDCICSGWGNSHYLTFDGTHYIFHDNCTYVLVKEIVTKHKNLSVLLDNYFCDAADGVSCPRSIIVNYDSNEILLVSQIQKGEITNKVKLNGFCKFSFTRDGISVAIAGTNMIVEIRDILASITFNGLTFSIKLPFNTFSHNTEGQCGTCSNDRSDECRLPNGNIASSCSEMAAFWKVPDSDKPYCEGPPTPPTPTPTPTSTQVPCRSTPLCELIMSDIFAECHEVLSPTMFYENCISDSCQNSNASVPCSSLEIYASLCTDKGVCTDWRSKTHGECCKLHYTLPQNNELLISEKWKSNCQECVCDPFSVTVQCKPLTCQTPPETPACEKEGFVPTAVLTAENPCCPETECSMYLLLSYSLEARAMQHNCTCCQELKSHKREVTLTCRDGTSINYDYIYVDQCQCMSTCIPETTTQPLFS
uniref:Mucin-5AC n=1 Tax=Sphenodon punctatus TaxID=8508 RepID=A0A8D0GA59_SPHPU